ncbi:hypothetical protein TorRG33x02_313210 [Trema orientale]|uniref:Uncharacterized protein n=1 Tax=Trema orientale TaxID=63057 RepID=A0A2P5BPR5_TREOI|nr:hypothetical protein TorRG33x02_313210 [Trema orientale]
MHTKDTDRGFTGRPVSLLPCLPPSLTGTLPLTLSPMTYSSLGNDLFLFQMNVAVAPDCGGASASDD